MAASTIQRIGVLTGGGDCPGLNAVIRAVGKTAIYEHGLRVFGIEDGFLGLIEDRVGELTTAHLSGILTRGGTILGANNKCNPRMVWVGNDAHGRPVFENKVGLCLKTIEKHRFDAVIIIGGDGTMSCAMGLVQAGVRCIGVPKTIDNDVVGTDLTFGFTTAMSTATESLDRLHTTAASHHRIMVCEVMGRNAGWLALHSGVASGSDVILLPEIPYQIESICRAVESRRQRHRGFSIIAVSEGARPIGGEKTVAKVDHSSPDPVRLGGVGERIAAEIEKRTGLETRTTVLGHVQRGGPPLASDRVLATQFGHRSIGMLMSGAAGRMVVMRDGRLGEQDIAAAADQQRTVPVDHDLIKAARSLKTCFGD